MPVVNREPAADARVTGAAASGSPHLDAAEVARLVRARWRLFRNVTLTVIGFVLAVIFALPSSYSSSSVVMLEPRKNNVTDQSSVLSDTPTDPASIQNQVQLLTSRDLAARVVDKLGLVGDPEFNNALSRLSLDPRAWLGLQPEETGQDEVQKRYDAVVTTFLKHLSVDAVGLSTTFTVTFSSRDAAKSALIANTIVDTYIETEAAIKFDVTQRTTEWLLDRIRQLGQQVQLAEANIQRYKAENNLNDMAGGGSLVEQQLAAINTQLVSARADLAAKQAENERIASLLKAGRAADVAQVVSSPLIVQLRDQQADVIRQESLLSTRYGARNPKLIAADAQKRDFDAKIEQEVSRIAGSVENEVDVARAQVRSLEESLQRAESQDTSDNMARVKLQSLEANAVSTRSMYEAFVTRLRETQGQDVMQMADAREISHAPVPVSPSSPPRLLIMAASIPAGLLLGLLAVLLAERFGASVETQSGADQGLRAPRDPLRGAPVLAEMAGVASVRAADFVVDQPMSPFAQTMRALAQRIASPAQLSRPKVFAVTSVDPREGQTIVAISLARAAAQLGYRVILVEGNLRAPAVAFLAGLPTAQTGITEVLSGAAQLSEGLRKDPRSGVLVLSVAQRYADSRAIWASTAVQRLMAHLRQVCDLVIIDAAPISAAGELPFIARLSDALLVVAARNEGPGHELTAALDDLGAIHAPPAGIVLTS